MKYVFYQEKDGSVSSHPSADAWYVEFMTREVAIIYGQIICNVFGGLFCVLERE